MCIDCKYYKGKCTNPNGCAEKEELQQVRADAINEFVTRFEEKYSRIAVHLGEFRKYQFEMHRLAEEMLKEHKQ